MSTPDYRARRQEQRAARLERAQRLRKWVPIIKMLCSKYGIEIREIPSGYQYRVCEYIVNWWPPTNKIVIQHPGDAHAKEFRGDRVHGEAKILTALKKLLRVTKGIEPSAIQLRSS
jgi:hypothetical protein